MKKFLCALLVLMLMIPVVAMAEGIKIGQVDYAAHGDKCFAVLTVAVDGDTIVAAYIDEFQFMPAASAVGVPNSDASFGEVYPEGQVLASKKVNSEYYSSLLKDHANATMNLDDNYAVIEAYVTGKTIAELEAAVEGKDAPAMVDAVSGCTLQDTLSYVNGLIEAAKSVQ